MSRNLPKPFFGTPPADYNVTYMDNIVRSFAIYIEQMQNPGEGRNSTQVFTDLPTNDSGLEDGSVFVVEGVLRIPVLNRPHLQGLSSTSEVGKVTVA
tara:strand:+ start:2227 stop:2517 length:291 start_codon:yes stop_codon:yes gene_type:complete